MRQQKKKTQRRSNSLSHIPPTLALHPSGEPIDWINAEDYACYKSRDAIIWSSGSNDYVIHGGINSKTNTQTVLSIDSMVMIRNEKNKYKKRKKPTLTNAALFSRDNNTCAYCGGEFTRTHLTRDHIHPVSKGGQDTWLNVVTACYNCNQKKGNMLLSECDMELRYQPYAPTHHENLILRNKRINKEQLDYLIIGVSPHSRIYIDYQAKLEKMKEKVE